MGEYYALGYLILEARIGRFWDMGPLAYSFPNLSIYQFASNNGILLIDIERVKSSSGAVPSKTASNIPVIKNTLYST